MTKGTRRMIRRNLLGLKSYDQLLDLSILDQAFSSALILSLFLSYVILALIFSSLCFFWGRQSISLACGVRCNCNLILLSSLISNWILMSLSSDHSIYQLDMITPQVRFKAQTLKRQYFTRTDPVQLKSVSKVLKYSGLCPVLSIYWRISVKKL